MIRHIAAVLTLGAVLAGCAAVQPIAQFAGRDAGNAAAMAGRAADPEAAARRGCYQAWASLAQGVGNVPGNAFGLFTGVEAGIEVQSTLRLPACESIAGAVVLWGLRHAPGGNLLP